jgi:type VI secretion system protein ImpA
VELKEDPAGSNIFRQVKDARQSARDLEERWRDFEMQKQESRKENEQAPSQPPTPDWNLVMDTAVTTIVEHSKDLWVAAWLIEALVRLHGFAGLRDGFRLARELCERFWDDIHPRPDEESGYGWTVTMLAQVTGGTLTLPLRSLSSRLLDPETADLSPEALQTVLEDIQQGHDQFCRLGVFLDEHCGNTPAGIPASPSMTKVREALETSGNLLQDHLGSGSTDEPETASLTAADSASGSGKSSTAGVSGRITSREEGFRVLSLVAQFFRSTEPHSPVSYHIEQAIRWGRMPLPDLWVELIPEDVRQDVFRRVGMSLPKEVNE